MRPNGAPINPTCGHTLCLGLQKGTRGLGQRSTRQPAVYSYTASHRSPLFRLDSPTRYHQHHCVHSIPTHKQSNLIVTSKHAISCNICGGHMISNNSYVS